MTVKSRDNTCWSKCDGCDACEGVARLEKRLEMAKANWEVIFKWIATQVPKSMKSESVHNSVHDLYVALETDDLTFDRVTK